ncbi:hypothetical protein SDRG_08665, partial [Saprolegnia diclina VS20]
MLTIYSNETHRASRGEAVPHESLQIDNWVYEIKTACAGFGTDEDKLSNALATKTASERYLISARYPELQRVSLLSEMKSEVSGSYGKLLQLLAQPLEEAEALIIRDATKGAGTNEKLVYPVLGGRTADELLILKKAYFKTFAQDMAVVLADDLGGDLKVFVQAILNINPPAYNPEIHTPAKAAEVAEVIYKAGEGKWGTDESAFCNALVAIPPAFLSSVNAAYIAKHGNSLERAIEKEFGGKAEDALLYHVGMILHPIETIAGQFEKTMKGIGTDEYNLSAAIVRYQHLLPQVKQAYKDKYDTPLRDRIYGETSGNYRKVLLAIVEQAS